MRFTKKRSRVKDYSAEREKIRLAGFGCHGDKQTASFGDALTGCDQRPSVNVKSRGKFQIYIQPATGDQGRCLGMGLLGGEQCFLDDDS